MGTLLQRETVNQIVLPLQETSLLSFKQGSSRKNSELNLGVLQGKRSEKVKCGTWQRYSSAEVILDTRLAGVASAIVESHIIRDRVGNVPRSSYSSCLDCVLGIRQMTA